MALVGHVDAITRAGVHGWAANPDEPAAPTALVVIVNGEPRLNGLADQPRPGLAASTRGRATDRSGFRFEFDPPLSPFDELRIEVVEAASGKPLPGGVHTLARPSRDGAATLAPIVVTAPGGEAVTQLLAEFARHPAIIIADRPPYETRQIAYHAAAFATLTSAYGRTRLVPPDTALAPPAAGPLGANPYSAPAFYDLVRPRTLLQTFYETRVPAHYATLFRSLILEFYETLRAGQGRHAAPYFCERGDLDEAARRAARLFFPRVKELVIVRDPRDVLAAGITAFKLPAEEAMAALRRVVAGLAAIRAEGAADTLLLRYEDLSLDAAASRRAIGGFLGLDLSPAEPGLPRPAGEAASTVGRWQKELAPELAAECEALFGAFMEAFDYRPGLPPLAESPAVPRRAAPPPAAPAPVAASVPAGAAGLTLAAEGAGAVAALRARNTDQGADGQSMKAVARLEFGRGQVGVAQLGTGWSRPEQGYVWSTERECDLALPPLRGPGAMRVWLGAAPLLHPEKLPAQTVTVLVNGTEIGSTALRGPSVMAFDLPAAAVAAGGRITLMLRLPDAARPADLGGSSDGRLLGVALRWMTVLRSGEG